MKIGTVTVHNGYNYGASLQARGLVDFLRKQGIEGCLLDYRTPMIENKRREATGWKKLVGRRGKRLRRERFDCFHRAMMAPGESPRYTHEDLAAANESFDGFICGSDQIWNSAITGLDSAFFLAFAQPGKKRIAYAPSMGGESVADEATFARLLETVDVLSVREGVNAPLVARLAGRPCQVAADPVLLLEKEDWDAVADTSQVKFPKKYVLYYTLHPDEALFAQAKELAERRGMQVLRLDILPGKAALKGCRSASGKGIGPAEFLAAVRGAEFVVTNSFHGTVFSLIYEKEFAVKLLSGSVAGKNLRIHELLGSTGMEARILKGDVFPEAVTSWEPVRQALARIRSRSARYLMNALEQE